MPKWVDDCVKKILANNPDVEENVAWATCNKLYNERVAQQVKQGIFRDEVPIPLPTDEEIKELLKK